MMIRLPFSPKAESTKALATVLDRTGDAVGRPSDYIAIMKSWFFQFLAQEVAQGRAVNIPGFGLFGATTYGATRRQADGSYGPGFARPRFYPARGFREFVKQHCPIHPPSEAIFNRFSKRHSRWDRNQRRKLTYLPAFHEFRKRVLRQSPWDWEELRKNVEETARNRENT